MHDPEFLLFDWRWLRVDVWHDEPGGQDAFSVCGHPPYRRSLRLRRLVWGFRHRHHLRWKWRPWVNLRKWLTDRCDECGQRFRYGEARYSYMGTSRVWHNMCQSLRHTRSLLDDLTNYQLGVADNNTRWRVENRIGHLRNHREHLHIGHKERHEGHTAGKPVEW